MLHRVVYSRAARIVLAVAVASTVASCKRGTPAAAQTGPLPVNVVKVIEKEIVEWDDFTGRIEAVESVEIRPRVSGYITAIDFKAGAIVKKGDLLFVIDPRPYEADLARATADVERAEAQMKLAQIEVDRAKDLRGKNTISASEFDQKAATYQDASAAVRASQAAKDLASLNLEFTQIKSPIDGRVSDARITLGNLVQPGAGRESVLTTVVSIDPLYVVVDADENKVLKYVKLDKEGKRATARTTKQAAYVELGNETGFPHEGLVDFVDNRIDPNTGTLRARVVLKSWSDLITPGFFARVRIAGSNKSMSTLVDDSVISSDQGQRYVWVVKPDHVVERRNIKVGPVQDGLRVVHEGLKAGEDVVSTRLQLLQPGMTVQSVPTPEKKN